MATHFGSDECERIGYLTVVSSEFDALGPLACMWYVFMFAFPDGLVCRIQCLDRDNRASAFECACACACAFARVPLL